MSKVRAKHYVVRDYWLAYYLEKGICSLCGNSGRVNTVGVKSAAGVHVGKINFCICPNGQIMRKQSEEKS